MSVVKKIGTIAGVIAALAVVAIGGVLLWGKQSAAARLAAKFETHRIDIPVPFPLSPEETEALRVARAASAGAAAEGAPTDPLAGVDLAAVALQQAQARGQHLVEARYACIECHGKNFGGGTMIDAPPIGKILGVNLTSGEGGVVAKYTMADWDRIVRHGVLPDGRPAAMPSEDFFLMTDRELSDIVAFIRAVPPVNQDVPRPTLGPVGTILMATRQLRLSAEQLKDHQAAHVMDPPKAEVTLEFGRHLVNICTGCHGASLAGGPIVGGDPSWPPALNLTPHADGLAGWSYEDFVRALRGGKRKDGTALKPPMSSMVAYAEHTNDTELQAMWKYLQSVPAAPTPKP